MSYVGREPSIRLADRERYDLGDNGPVVEFFEASLVVVAKEGRFKALGRLADGAIAVIFATLGTEAVSVISMRPASDTERKLLS